MDIASMETKTVFDVARPKHIAKILKKDTHDWISAALQSEMGSLQRQATFENVEKSFSVTRCIRHGSVEAPTQWLQMTIHIFWNVERAGRRS